MLRRLMLSFAVLVIAGCATRYEYYGDERYAGSGDGYQSGVYDDGYGSGYADGGYYGGTYGYGTSNYRYDTWYEYPAYYSMFWSLNRWYVDPFWHPHFYYGVTWFPRSYFDVSFRSFPRYAGGFWPPYYRYVPYAPYRGAWVDHYYDWTPWYAHHPHIRHHYAPRYGNVRYEADRLSDWSRHRGSYERWRDEDRRIRRYDEPRTLGDVRDRRESYRGANPGGGSSSRIDPQVRGFDAQRGAQSRDARRDSRGAAPTRVDSNRVDPGVRGFSSSQDRRAATPRSETSRAATPVDRAVGSGNNRATEPRSAYRAPPTAPRDSATRIESDKPTYAPRAPVDRGERPQTTTRRDDYEVTRVPSPRASYGSRPNADVGRTPAAPSRSTVAPSSGSRSDSPSYRLPQPESRGGERGYQRESPTSRSYSAPAQPSYQAPSRSPRDAAPSASRQPQFEMRQARPEPPAPRQERPAVREARDDDDRGGRGRGRNQDE